MIVDNPAVRSDAADNAYHAIVAVVAIPRTQGRGVLGTAFLDHRDTTVAVTAQHVISSLSEGSDAYLMVAPNGGGWLPIRVSQWEGHPTEDIAVLRLDHAPPTGSLGLAPSAAKLLVGETYFLFGYPDDDYFQEHDPRVSLHAAYIQGYLRRRLDPVALPGLRGIHFLELSTVAGGGCSGAPIITENGVVGVYVGDRRPERDGTPVGYAAPFAAIADWEPTLLGGPIVAHG